MKICNKCKKKVTNKTKICNRCGADVSKCKIIKNNSQKNIARPKNIEKIETKKEEIIKELPINEKPKVEQKQEKNNKAKAKQKNTKEKRIFKENLNKVKEKIIQTTNNKIDKVKEKELKKAFKEKLNKTKEIIKITHKNIKEKITQTTNNQIKKVKEKELKKVFKEKLNKTNDKIKKQKEKKAQLNEHKRKIKQQNKEQKTKQKQENKEQKIKQKQEQTKQKQESKEQKIKQKQEQIKQKQENKEQKIKQKQEKNIKEPKQRKKLHIQIKKKKLVIILIIITTIFMITYGALLIFKDSSKTEQKRVEGEQATNEKLFGMGDIITYKGVNYQVLSIEASEGNNYKKPKEGNEFVIVTIQYENNTENKIKYSYKNWTMSNSKDEEEKRIFTSINVDTALYSGELVVGGIKRGSMVFEQPKSDDKLKLNFYELKMNEDKTEEIDKDKKIFSVSLKMPKETETVSKEETNE